MQKWIIKDGKCRKAQPKQTPFTHKQITATFKNGRQITFTDGILELLTSDPEIITLINAETGEIILTR